jgi:hypothetical protein
VSNYSPVLRHTTKEVYAACIEALNLIKLLEPLGCVKKLWLVKYSREQWVELAKEPKATIIYIYIERERKVC